MAALLWITLLGATAVAWSLKGPWLGLNLKAQGDALQIVAVRGPAAGAGIEPGAVLRAIEAAPVGVREGPSAGHPQVRLAAETAPSSGVATDGPPGLARGAEVRIELRANDIAEEPDMVERYATLDGFFERQGWIAAVLDRPQVTLEWQSPSGELRRSTLSPAERPLSSLPWRFVFQLGVASLACLIACWVWSLRPTDWGACMFGLTGLLLPLSAHAAGVYGARELALPAAEFAALSGINHGSAALWGAAFVGIFMAHPRRLVSAVWLAAPFAMFGAWWLLGQLRQVDGLDAGIRLLLMTELLAAIALALWQWRLSRGEPLQRAALRWFLLSLLLGSSLFIASIIVTVVLGWLPPLPQGYAFGFFLLIYAGIALGLRRHRLFELDALAWRMLAWAGGIVAVLALDALLIALLDWSQGTALGVSLWVCGLLYFPARQLFWARLVHRQPHQLTALMPDIVAIAFQDAANGREARWQALLQGLFDPLDIAPSTPDAGRMAQGEGRTHVDALALAAVIHDGLGLTVPPCAGMPGLFLRYAARGRRLFTADDARFVSAVCALMNEAAAGRDARERGAAAERRRVAQDMHDDVGARLLMLIHRAPSPDLAELARAAMADLRAALSALEAHAMPLADVLADSRAEAAQRCEAAGAELDWQGPTQEPLPGQPPMTPRQRLLFERALREGLTNALKHGSPRRVTVVVDRVDEALTLSVVDDGAGPPPMSWIEGRGLRGMRQRLAEFGGSLSLTRSDDDRTELQVRLPLREGG
ncbi:MAG: sensor histidine kinase [Rubrivivax sp.]